LVVFQTIEPEPSYCGIAIPGNPETEKVEILKELFFIFAPFIIWEA